jgi:hypothetical protein
LFTAVVRVTGAGRLADFRERLRFLMVRDADAEDYSEHHAEGLLEYRFEPKKGIPFPALTATSGEFPELRVDVAWDHDGERGRAVIENGRVLEKSRAQPDSPGVEVRVGEDGRLILGLVINHSMMGYAVTADRHTYFRYREGALTLVDPKEPDAELEEAAVGFVEEWIWYDEEEAPVERARYADYGYPVRGANVRSEKLALLRSCGMRYSSLDETTRQASEALAAEWLNRS